MSTAVDVLVVGAGPAGAAAGLAARDGAWTSWSSTRPRSRATRPAATASRPRRCASSSSSASTCADSPATWRCARPSSSAPSGRHVSLPLADDGDHAGSCRASSSTPRSSTPPGARASRSATASPSQASRRTATASRATTDGDGSVRARFVIAADGHYSFVRRCLRAAAPPELGTWHAFRQYFRGVDDQRLCVLFEPDLLPGYAWVFPLPERRAPTSASACSAVPACPARSSTPAGVSCSPVRACAPCSVPPPSPRRRTAPGRSRLRSSHDALADGRVLVRRRRRQRGRPADRRGHRAGDRHRAARGRRDRNAGRPTAPGAGTSRACGARSGATCASRRRSSACSARAAGPRWRCALQA